MAEREGRAEGVGMPTIQISMLQLERGGLQRGAVPELIDRLGMSVEKTDSTTITIEVTPNRPDLLEANGLVRAMKLISGRTAPNEKHYRITNQPALRINVCRGVRRIRPFIAGIVVRRADMSSGRLKEFINFTEKLGDTYGRKRRKMAIGVYDLKRIKGKLYYDASKDGKIIPLDNQNEMRFEDVLKRDQRGAEFGYVLEGFKSYPYLRDDEKTLSLIPIVNSEKARVSESATELFIEATGTSAVTVNDTMRIVASLFIDAGADVYPCTIIKESTRASEATPKMEGKEIRVPLAKIARTLGISMGASKAIEMGNRMGYVAAQYGNSIMFMVPPYRVDAISQRDIIEDIAIAYGYNKINPLPVYGTSMGMPDETSENTQKLAGLMVGMGFTEAINMCLTNEKQNFETMNREPGKETITVAYAKTESVSMLRTSVLPSLLASLSCSAQATMPQMLFEIGSVFRMEGDKPREGASLAFVSEHSKSNFSEIKSYLLGLLNTLQIRSVSVDEESDPAFIEGRCASLNIGGAKAGVFGEIHPQVLRNFKLEEPVSAAEIDISILLSKL
jgi:phenylalanyl-tRNA synthetase beta chain